MTAKMKIRKGDEVMVIKGRDRGKKGSVLRVITKESRVLVQGVNVAKRHTKQTPNNPGGIVDKEQPLHVSNVALLDPRDSKPTRVGYKLLEGGRKVRFARRSGEVIDR
jgi:large subunit ribosomal protein L24